jgi:hypothetical protein
VIIFKHDLVFFMLGDNIKMCSSNGFRNPNKIVAEFYLCDVGIYNFFKPVS